MLIGQLADATGVTAKTLRFYEDDGLLPAPDRTPGGYRSYPRSAVDRVRFIRRAQAAGLTLADIRQILAIRDGGLPPCEHVALLVDRRLGQIGRRLTELEHTREELRALRDRLEVLDAGGCQDVGICAAIPSTPPDA
jgi:DNA-binding transcriptional MerR regulator